MIEIKIKRAHSIKEEVACAPNEKHQCDCITKEKGMQVNPVFEKVLDDFFKEIAK